MARDPDILTYAQTLQGGGVERVALRLAGAWAARGRRVLLVIGCDMGPLAAEVPDGVERVVLGSRRYRDLARAVLAIVRERRPRVIFCPGNHYTGVAAWTRARLGRACPPTVAKLSNALDRDDMGPASRLAYRAWLRAHPHFLDTLVAMTPAMAAQAEQAMHMPAARISVIPNPPALSRHSSVDHPPLPPRYLLGVGRLTAQKRWDRVIDALPALADRAIPLVILGEGPERAALTARADARGVDTRVILPGHVGDPLPAMAGAALVVLASDYEGVPGALRESLSVGTPVVTTDSSVAIREIVTAPHLGTVVPRGDAAALVAALDHWLAPETPRPAPFRIAGDPAGDYLSLFDSLSSLS